MLIEPNKQYRVLCKKVSAIQLQQYVWHLDVKADKKAWKIVNQNVEVGSIVHGHLILSISDCTPDSISANYQNSHSVCEEEDLISEEEFTDAINGSSFSYAASPFFGHSYRCQICNGVVANDICTDCMFDWDS